MKYLINILFFYLLSIGSVCAQNVNWAYELGDNRFDEGQALAIDEEGNVFVTGSIQSTAVFDGDSTTAVNWLVAKYGTGGLRLWKRELASISNDFGQDIATDNTGNVYVTGGFSRQLATSIGDTLSAWSGTDILTVKYDNAGKMLWSSPVYSLKNANGVSIVADESGNSYTLASIQDNIAFDVDTIQLSSEKDSIQFNGDLYVNPDFPLIIGDDTLRVFNESDTLQFNSDTIVTTSTVAFRLFSNIEESIGGLDLLLLKYDVSGNLLWHKIIGGQHSEVVESMAIDEVGNLVITGFFSQSARLGDVVLNAENGQSMFVAKLDTDGSVLWAKQASGDFDNVALSVNVDNQGNIYVAGVFFETVAFENTNLQSNGETDAFIAQYNNDGALQWVKQIGGTGNDKATAITTSPMGGFLVTGVFENELLLEGQTLVAQGDKDIFIARYNQTGGLSWVNSLGDVNFEESTALVAKEDKIYMLGNFVNQTEIETITLTSNGNFDIFLAQLTDGMPLSTVDLPTTNTELEVYPNPTISSLYVNIPTSEPIILTLIDMYGKKLLSKKIWVESSKKEHIQVGHLPKGMYVLHLVGARNEWSKRVVIK